MRHQFHRSSICIVGFDVLWLKSFLFNVHIQWYSWRNTCIHLNRDTLLVQSWRLLAITYIPYRPHLWIIPFRVLARLLKMSRDMTKPTKWVCSQQRLRSAWTSAQSNQESSLWVQSAAKDRRFRHADSEVSDQTGRMSMLIWVFAGHTATLLVLSCHSSNMGGYIAFPRVVMVVRLLKHFPKVLWILSANCLTAWSSHRSVVFSIPSYLSGWKRSTRQPLTSLTEI